MAGTLYVVATPIGNLEDVTLRALRILREVSLVAAEDTRRTAKLLQHYSISTRTTSLHEHNEHEKAPGLVDRLRAGESIAIVSDAGTPVISDPGQGLVSAARAAGIRVESIPGPSAVMAAIAASGLPASEFVFLGFPPIRSNARKLWIDGIRKEQRLVVFFEAPHRINRTLLDLAGEIGNDHAIAIGRELTKAHEELVVQPISEWLARPTPPRGEFTVLVPPSPAPLNSACSEDSLENMRAELGQLTDKMALSRRDALKELSRRHGVPVNELYRRLKDSDG